MEVKGFNRNSITVRLFIIGLLILILMFPSAMIGSLINEREERKKEAITEVTSKWARQQTVGGPVVTVPYEDTWKDDKGKTQLTIGHIQILPDVLEISGKIQPEVRYRGIYKAILYNTRLSIKGSFSFAKVDSLDSPFQKINWKDAFIAVLIPDMRGIKDYIELNWNGQNLLLEPGIKSGNNLFDSGASVKIPLNNINFSRDNYNFSLSINLNGSEELNFLPLGRRTTVQLESTWNNPSFDGAFLPEERQIDKNGFTAVWKVLDLNRNYPQRWIGETNQERIAASKFGVKLFSPVDEYQKTTRAIKYLIMFIGLTFLIFFLVEVFNKKRIHPIQYLLIGVSLCIFYILLLSLSEHLSFELAYFIAGLGITALITTYVGNALGGKVIPFVTAALLIVLYGFMYILLQNQDYALLLGSIGIFIIMAVVMYLSRNVDWYKIEMNS